MFKLLKRFFLFELERIAQKKKLLLLLLIAVVSLYLMQDGIDEFKATQQNIKTFQEIEKLKVTKFTNITQYGTYGFRVLFIPAPLTVLFNNSTVFSDIVSAINTSERLEIYSPFKGKILFAEKSGGFTDFSGFVYLIGCFLVCLYGLETFKNKEYLKLIGSLAKYKKIYFSVIISRIILIFITFLLLAGLCHIWAFIKGITIFNVFFFYYMILTMAAFIFFFFTGLIIGLIKDKVNQVFTFVLVYLVLIFFIPWTIGKITSNKASQITPLYQLEMEKLDTITNFERRALGSQGNYTKAKGKTDAGKYLGESFWNGEFRQMQGIEERMIKEMEKSASTFQWYSIIFPTSFYRSIVIEISSRGYTNFLQYYRYIKEIDKKFMRFYIDKKYYSESEKIEPFVKGNENIFYASPLLPNTFWLGVFLTFFYSFLLLMVAFKNYGKFFKTNESRSVNMELLKNNAFILCENRQIKNAIFQFFNKQRDSSCLEKINASDFRFNLSPGQLFKHLCKINRANKYQAAQNLALLGIEYPGNEPSPSNGVTPETILKIYAAIKMSGNHEYIVLDDFFKNETRQFENSFLELLTTLEKAGKKIIYLSCEMFYPRAAIEINDKLILNNYQIFSLPLDKVMLR